MTKQCRQCGSVFGPTLGRSKAQWDRQQFCKAACANRWRAQQQTPNGRRFGDWGAGDTPNQRKAYRYWMQRAAHTWATQWEVKRRWQDLVDLEADLVRLRGPVCYLKHRPVSRRFVGSICRGCGVSWIQYAARIDSDLCSRCTKAKWRMNHYQRATYYGVASEWIDPFIVFAEDGHRCQLCGLKTYGRYPNPRSATLDHIVPLSVGGPHLRHNVQTACLRCNVLKGDRAANDQLRLAC